MLTMGLEQHVGGIVGSALARVSPGCPVQRVAEQLRVRRCDAVVICIGSPC